MEFHSGWPAFVNCFPGNLASGFGAVYYPAENYSFDTYIDIYF